MNFISYQQLFIFNKNLYQTKSCANTEISVLRSFEFTFRDFETKKKLKSKDFRANCYCFVKSKLFQNLRGCDI